MKYSYVMMAILIILIACVPVPEDSKADEVVDELKKQAVNAVVEEVKEEVQEPEVVEEPEEVEEPQETEEVDDAVENLAEELEDEETDDVSVSDVPRRTRMYQFLDTFTEKVEGYQFNYKSNNYFVRGTRYKILLYKHVTFDDYDHNDIQRSLFYYDTVYIDRATKSAVAYCEGNIEQINRECAQLDLYDLPLPVPYKEYDIILPEDWLFENLDIEPNIVDPNKYYIKGRITTMVRFNTDPILELNFDKGTGLVLRADRKDGSIQLERFDYEDLVSNKVREVDVIHRTKDEIPSEETFYR